MELERLSRRKSSCICLRMLMKTRFLKSMLVLSSVLALVNCDTASDAISNNTTTPPAQVSASDAAWLLNVGQDLLIYPAGVVTDANGTVVGTVEFTDANTATITIIADGSEIQNINLSMLTLTTLENLINKVIEPTSSATIVLESSASELPALSSANELPVLSSANELPDLSSASLLPELSSASIETSSDSNDKTSSSSNAKIESSSSEKNQTQSSSSQTQQSTGKVTVTGNLTQTVAKGAAISKVTFNGVESKPQRNWTLHFL